MAVDKWKNTRQRNPSSSVEEVAAVALPDAASAMFLTTLTTAVAFFATAICPVAPIKLFAVFCGFLIMFDYLMNVFLVFPALCIYDNAITANDGNQKVNCCISFTCSRMAVPQEQKNGDDGKDDDDEEDLEEGREVEKKEDKSEPSGLVQRILLSYYEYLHKARWILFGLCLVALGLSIYFATTLQLPTSSDVRLLTEDVQFEQNYVQRQNLLSTALENASGSQASFIWGVEPADTGDQSKFISFLFSMMECSIFTRQEHINPYLLEPHFFLSLST